MWYFKTTASVHLKISLDWVMGKLCPAHVKRWTGRNTVDIHHTCMYHLADLFLGLSTATVDSQ